MSWIVLLLVAGALWLSYANGANDNFKGVATLFGTGTTDYRRALTWATATTFLGSVASVFIASALLSTFSGKGIVSDAALSEAGFPVAVGLGAAATIMCATRLGIPVSTTHALVGALVGAGWVAPGAGLDLAVLGGTFVLPLLLSPFAALALTMALYGVFRAARSKLGVAPADCLCLGADPELVEGMRFSREAAPALLAVAPAVSVGTAAECGQKSAMAVWTAQGVLDRAHFLSAGAVGFARGLNDTPKIAALLLAAPVLTGTTGVLLAGLAIALGGLLSARRVAETMSHKITGMNHGQGFAANAVTALLVIFASRFGLPVSTTHVSCGSLFGIGLARGGARWRVILSILLAWITTLPLAALLAAAIFLTTR